MRRLVRAFVVVGVLAGGALAIATPAASQPPGGTFVDDDGNLHEASIEAIVQAGITTGCSTEGPNRYCPEREVTRGQMASFLARGLDLPATSTDHFDDDDGTTHEDAINRVAEAGIAAGVGERRYRPGASVLRGQMATFLTRALDLPATSTDHFDDDDGTTHEDAINRVAEAGITTGSGNRTYRPNAAVRRDQMASFLARALDLSATPPPSRALAEGPGVVAAVMDDLTNGGGNVDTAVAMTTGIAGVYTRYVRDLVETTPEQVNESWGLVSEATSAEPLGDHRHRLVGMRLDWAREDGSVDRVDEIVVRVDPTTGDVTLHDFHRRATPLASIVRSLAGTAQNGDLVARLRANFQDASYPDPPLLVSLEIENRSTQPIQVGTAALVRDDGQTLPADEVHAPTIPAGEGAVVVLVWDSADIRAHGGELDITASSAGLVWRLTPRLPAWPR